MARRWDGESFNELRLRYFNTIISSGPPFRGGKYTEYLKERERLETIRTQKNYESREVERLKKEKAELERRANLRPTSTAEDLLKLFEKT